jgi:hypothetical protein
MEPCSVLMFTVTVRVSRRDPVTAVEIRFRAANVVIWLTDLFEFVMEVWKVKVDIPYNNFFVFLFRLFAACSVGGCEIQYQAKGKCVWVCVVVMDV